MKNIDFEQATSLVGEKGQYTVELYESWGIWGPNGGYIAAICLRAAGKEAFIKRPVSLQCQLLSTPSYGIANVVVTCIKNTRHSELFSVCIYQGEKILVYAIVRTATSSSLIEYDGLALPDVPSPDELLVWSEAHPQFEKKYGSLRSREEAFWDNFVNKPIEVYEEMRAYVPELLEWVRFVPRSRFGDVFLDLGRAVLLIDLFAWFAASLPIPETKLMAPNMDLSVMFHNCAAQTDWLLVIENALVSGEGFIGTNGKIYSQDLCLVASGSSQLYLKERPSIYR